MVGIEGNLFRLTKILVFFEDDWQWIVKSSANPSAHVGTSFKLTLLDYLRLNYQHAGGRVYLKC